MSKFIKKVIFWFVLISLMIGSILFINQIINENKTEKKESSSPNDESPKPTPSSNDTENWWLTDEEIEHAYQEIRKELKDYPKIQLVSPSVVRVIQKGGEISEDLKKAEIIFFPINNSEDYETVDSGSHWTLLVFQNTKGVAVASSYNSLGSSIPDNARKLVENLGNKLKIKEQWLPVRIYNDCVPPQQTNNADCGVYVIAYTRA